MCDNSGAAQILCVFRDVETIKAWHEELLAGYTDVVKIIRNAPGVGTPVMNGLTNREGFIICEILADTNRLLAIDMVETNPLLDNRNITGTMAAELILTCIGKTDYQLFGL
ncbi:MAG: arginase family protein [Lachnospiraceae bacterium]|nr:arginase family protein [Lachnospiraceae bacterium]